MATFLNASVLGVSQKSQFLGEGVARLRTIKTFTIDGFIDSRFLNSDIEGVKETIAVITNLNKTISGPTSNTPFIMENIIINGTNYGLGKVISLDYKASSSFDENQITIGKYSAVIEFYLAGDISSIYGFVVPSKEFLEDFSENFNFSLSEENIYSYDHSVKIKYIAGIKNDLTELDPIAAAKVLATNVFSQTLNGFDGLVDIHPADYGSLGKKYFTEQYDKQTGECSFTKKFTVLQKSEASYSATITNTFNVSEDGITTVSEHGEIHGRTVNLLTSALAGLETEKTNSYARCDNIYNVYKAAYLLNVGGPLINLFTTLSISINNNTGNVEYDLTYSNDEGLNALGFLKESTVKYEEKETSSTVEESVTITTYGDKNLSYISSSVSSLSLLSAESLEKCSRFYSTCRNLLYINLPPLKKIKSSISVPVLGKSYTYSFSFTNSGDVFPANSLAEKVLDISDENLGPVFVSFQIPNKAKEFLHFPSQQNLNSRTVSLTAKLSRRQYNSNFIDFAGFSTLVHSVIPNLFAELKLKAYQVYSERNKIRFWDKSEIFISDFKYSVKSDNSMTMSVQVSYPSVGGKILS